MPTTTDVRERQDLLETLAIHRFFLRQTVAGLSDEQAGLRPTASQLCLGGIIRHVTWAERMWTAFIVDGAEAMSGDHGMDETTFAASFAFGPGDSLQAVLDDHEAVEAATKRLVEDLDDLDADHALPPAPWFEPGARWSARRVLLSLIAEISQHAGHADIIRETIDGTRIRG
jgi:hypothetical protein